mmetsp:Transcript_94383/g.215955  ORF Transcript_94383/g.215955 Transcript_94383/m.215955 type:complete len:711 (+) Transcript_94383:28-2160(+)
MVFFAGSPLADSGVLAAAEELRRYNEAYVGSSQLCPGLHEVSTAVGQPLQGDYRGLSVLFLSDVDEDKQTAVEWFFQEQFPHCGATPLVVTADAERSRRGKVLQACFAAHASWEKSCVCRVPGEADCTRQSSLLPAFSEFVLLPSALDSETAIAAAAAAVKEADVVVVLFSMASASRSTLRILTACAGAVLTGRCSFFLKLGNKARQSDIITARAELAAKVSDALGADSEGVVVTPLQLNHVESGAHFWQGIADSSNGYSDDNPYLMPSSYKDFWRIVAKVTEATSATAQSVKSQVVRDTESLHDAIGSQLAAAELAKRENAKRAWTRVSATVLLLMVLLLVVLACTSPAVFDFLQGMGYLDAAPSLQGALSLLFPYVVIISEAEPAMLALPIVAVSSAIVAVNTFHSSLPVLKEAEVGKLRVLRCFLEETEFSTGACDVSVDTGLGQPTFAHSDQGVSGEVFVFDEEWAAGQDYVPSALCEGGSAEWATGLMDNDLPEALWRPGFVCNGVWIPTSTQDWKKVASDSRPTPGLRPADCDRDIDFDGSVDEWNDAFADLDISLGIKETAASAKPSQVSSSSGPPGDQPALASSRASEGSGLPSGGGGWGDDLDDVLAEVPGSQPSADKGAPLTEPSGCDDVLTTQRVPSSHPRPADQSHEAVAVAGWGDDLDDVLADVSGTAPVSTQGGDGVAPATEPSGWDDFSFDEDFQ